MADVTARVQGYGLDNAGSPAWIDIDDVSVDEILRHNHGINGSGPVDCVAGSGELLFAARNGPGNNGSTRGWYAIGHASARTGWAYGMPIRVVYTYNGGDYVGWTGKLSDTDPDPHYDGDPLAHVVAYDHQHDLVEADVLDIAPQIGQTEDTLLGVILDALPVDSQPLARDIDAGIDSYSYALYKLGAKTKAASAIKDIETSGLHLQWTDRSGTFRHINRQTRFTQTPIGSLDDTTLTGFAAPSSQAGVWNSIKATYHPPRVDDVDVVLWEQTGRALFVRAGETVTDSVTYRNPDQNSQTIGAKSITAPVSGVDYIANDAEDGGGSNVTADFIVSLDDKATTATWSINNNGSVDAWVTTRRIKGKGIYDDDAPFVTASSVQKYQRVLELDLVYQDNRYIAQGIANLLLAQRESLVAAPVRASFLANESDTLMLLALQAEVGDVINVTNANTGVVSSVAEIRRIELELQPGNQLWVTFDLAATSSLTDPPSAPTGLSTTITSDSSADAHWTNTDGTSETELYVDGALWRIAPIGATSIALTGLQRAVNQSVTARHIRFALIRSSATAPTTCRPRISVSSVVNGTVFQSGGFEFVDFLISGSFTQDVDGRMNWVVEGGGGGGGGGGDNAGGTVGGGGGGGGGYDYQTDNQEPAGSHTVVIGGGGAGGTTNGTNGNPGSDGSDSTYRSTIGVGRRGGGGGYVNGGNGFAGSGGSSIGCGGGGAAGGAVAGAGGVGFQTAGGSGYGAGVGNSGGGGGGGGAGGAGATPGGGLGGAGGVPVTLFINLGQGGRGGNVASPAAGAANTGNGGDGGDNVNNGKAGGSGWMRIWYPI